MTSRVANGLALAGMLAGFALVLAWLAPSRLVLEKKETEITALFTALGAALVVLAAALSVGWFNRVM